MDASDLFADMPIVPVVVIESAAAAVPLAEALVEAGVGAIEITLRTDAALDAIEQIAAGVPQIVVGAGSIRRADQFRQVADAGARFAVSPGATPRLLEAASALRLPFVPGASTASEMLALLEAGYILQKFFPAEQSGGLARLRALAAPLPEVRFFPTGGITARLARDYLAYQRVTCIGGSWFVPPAKLAAGDFAGVGRDTAAAVAVARELRPRAAG